MNLERDQKQSKQPVPSPQHAVNDHGKYIGDYMYVTVCPILINLSRFFVIYCVDQSSSC